MHACDSECMQDIYVEGGKPGTEDYDFGRVINYLENDRVVVAWNCGFSTDEDLRSLQIIEFERYMQLRYGV